MNVPATSVCHPHDLSYIERYDTSATNATSATQAKIRSLCVGCSCCAPIKTAPLILSSTAVVLCSSDGLITCASSASMAGSSCLRPLTLIKLSRMDTAQIASVNVGIGKARTAAIYRRPSRVFEEQIRDARV
jgi:hypothetical protein